MGKFQRKTKEERCAEIMVAAKKVFLQKGYHHTTMEDVIKETTLSKGGVYQYYKSTKQIMFDIMQAGNYMRNHKTETLITQIKSDDVYEMITQALLAKILDDIPEKKLFLMFLAEIVYDKDHQDLFFKLEEQTFKLVKLLIDRYTPEIPQLAIIKKKINEKKHKSIFLMYSRIFTSLIIMYELFDDKKNFKKAKDELHDFVYTTVKQILR